MAEYDESKINGIVDRLDDFDKEVETIKCEGLSIRAGNRVLRFVLESDSSISIEDEIKKEYKEKLREKLNSLKSIIEDELREMRYVVSSLKTEYERKERELDDKLARSKPMPEVFEEHARLGLSVINSKYGGVIWLVRRVYWPRFVDGKRIEPAYVKKLITNIILKIVTDKNGKVVECSTRNIGDFEYFSHYHQSRPDCWGGFSPYSRTCKTPEEVLLLADEAMSVLENINTGSIAKRNPVGLPRLETLRNHLLPDDADVNKSEVPKTVKREVGSSLEVENENIWNTTEVPF